MLKKLVLPTVTLFSLLSLAEEPVVKVYDASTIDKEIYTCYRSFWPELEMTAKFAEMGINTRCFFAANAINSLGFGYCKYPLIWEGINKYDFDAYDKQVDDLLSEAKAAAEKNQRVLVTVLTKKMAEDLTEYLAARGVRAKYIHSDIDTLERIEILSGLRKGDFDCLVGVNLLREGLDLPEVALVAILDADKEGFLRSGTSLIQVCGRAARNLEGRVIMYADRKTGAISRALEEMSRRRARQIEFNREHGITPRSIVKAVREDKEFRRTAVRASLDRYGLKSGTGDDPKSASAGGSLESMREDMKEAADMLDFELAAAIRDRIYELENR